MDDDIDQHFDTFERLGLIYISRNRAPMIFSGSRFTKNIGTFGGAITIDSPNWESGSKPYIVISDCKFINNLAYFGGNAVYIRNTKKPANVAQICAGVFMESSTFFQNIGTKAHNGGAVSAICTYLTTTSH